jgi:hypothetical protein
VNGCCVLIARGAALFDYWNMAEANANHRSEQSDLERIAAILLHHGVEFLVVGGQAEALMGSPRVTYDTDLCYRRTKENLERLADALKELSPTLRGAPPDLPFTLDARALAFGSNYTLNTLVGPLDLLGWVEPLGVYESLLPRSETYEIGDLTLHNRLGGFDPYQAAHRSRQRPRISTSTFGDPLGAQ